MEVTSRMGNFFQTKSCQLGRRQHTTFKEKIVHELDSVRMRVEDELAYFKAAGVSKSQRSERLLYLFVKDLLTGVNGDIVDMKVSREKRKCKPVSKYLKIFGWVIYLALNIGMLLFIYLFAMQQPKNRQVAWLLSFVVWIVCQVFFVSSGVVFLLHIILPMITMKDISKIKLKLTNEFNNLKTNTYSKSVVSNVNDMSTNFNAAKYFYVSNRIAKEFPDLLESQIVLQFTTRWPKLKQSEMEEMDAQYKITYSVFAFQIGMYFELFFFSYVYLQLKIFRYFSLRVLSRCPPQFKTPPWRHFLVAHVAILQCFC